MSSKPTGGESEAERAALEDEVAQGRLALGGLFADERRNVYREGRIGLLYFTRSVYGK